MAQTIPPTPSAAPAVPDRTDRATFSTRATNAFDYIKNVFFGDLGALATNVYNNAVDAYNNAVAAAASAVAAAGSASAAAGSVTTSAANAAAAAASAGATLWVSGTTYAIGNQRIDPANNRLYVRRTAGAGTTNPNADPTNWQVADTSLVKVSVVTATFTAAAGTVLYLNGVTGFPLQAQAVTLNATPSDGERVKVVVNNGLLTNTIDPGSKQVRGYSNLIGSGVGTLDLAGPMDLQFDGSTNMWVQQ